MNCPHCEVHIDEHSASRCLDAWVAEIVMGWKPYFIISYNILYPPTRQSYCEEQSYIYNNYKPNKPYEFDSEHFYDSSRNPSYTQPIVPFYSKRISVAWKIVEQVNQDNAMTLRWYNPDGRTSTYSIAFGFGKKIEAEADTAPLVICRAAIKIYNG